MKFLGAIFAAKVTEAGCLWNLAYTWQAYLQSYAQDKAGGLTTTTATSATTTCYYLCLLAHFETEG